MKLLKPLAIERFGKEKETIIEIEIKKEKFTAGVILKAEHNFLINGGTYPVGEMEGSRAFLTYVLAEMEDLRYEELEKLAGIDLIKLTDEIKGFFGTSALEKLKEMILEKPV